MTSLRCSQCGEESPQTAAFCFACGKPIVSTPQFELNPESTATSNNRLKYISGGIVVVLFLAFLFVYHEGKVKVDPKSQPATNVPNSSIENPAANVPKPKQSLLNSLLKLPVKNTIVVGPLTMTFGKFSQAKEFEFERYPGESQARNAIRGKKYMTANVDIGSKDKKPQSSMPLFI